MMSRRGGRVQVNVLQFNELKERVARLEALLEPEKDLTKGEIMTMLDEKDIKYNKRSTKDSLLELLNGVELCQND